MTTNVMEKIEVDIDRKSVCRYIGYSGDVEPSSRIENLLAEYMGNARHLIDASYDYVIRDVIDVTGNIAILEGDLIFESEVISSLLSRCQKAVLFVVTIGKHLEEISAKLADDRMIVESYVLDSIGSTAVENLAGIVQDIIGEMVGRDGFVISRRFSPGYCDWDIQQQEMLFSAFDGREPLVQLSSSNLMSPQKSISSLIGIGYKQDEVENYYPCGTCQKRNCVGRR